MLSVETRVCAKESVATAQERNKANEELIATLEAERTHLAEQLAALQAAQARANGVESQLTAAQVCD